MSITAKITARMLAAQKAQTATTKELVEIGQQAERRHNEIAGGKGKLSSGARDAALNALQATAAFCKASAQGNQAPA